MYDELVGRLRYCAEEHGGCGTCALSNDCVLHVGLLMKSADAIEELQKERNVWKATAEDWRDAYHHWFENYQKDVPKWIPVTEQLPDEEVYVLAVEEDGFMFIAYISDWDHEWHYRDDMSTAIGPKPIAWMPLSEPPKEE